MTSHFEDWASCGHKEIENKSYAHRILRVDRGSCPLPVSVGGGIAIAELYPCTSSAEVFNLKSELVHIIEIEVPQSQLLLPWTIVFFFGGGGFVCRPPAGEGMRFQSETRVPSFPSLACVVTLTGIVLRLLCEVINYAVPLRPTRAIQRRRRQTHSRRRPPTCSKGGLWKGEGDIRVR